MGNICKACDQNLSENQNEILGEIIDSGNLYNRKEKMNRIMDEIISKSDIDFKIYIPTIIFLQRQIKKYL